MIEFIGIVLAIAAALDFALKKKTKIQFARRIERFATSSAPVDQGGYQYVQKLFGEKIFSRRAILVSLILSIVSLVFSYFYAFVTSDFHLIWVFEYRPSVLAISFFILFLAGSLIGDVFSYAQTRVFLKTIDDYKTGVVSIGLALADAIISLALFVIVFTFTRLVAYLIIVSGISGGQLNSTQLINLDLIKDEMPQLVASGHVQAAEVDWLNYIANATEEDSSIIDNSLRLYNEQVVGPFGSDAEFSLSAEVSCAPYMAQSLVYQDTVMMIAKSAAGARGISAYDGKFLAIRDDVSAKLSDWSAPLETIEDIECAFRVLKIDRNMSPGRLLDVAGPTNAWWAAFQMTFQDAYSSIAYKFGPYVSIDPFNDIDRFYDSVIAQSGYSLLDLTYADPTIPFLLSEFSYNVPENSDRMQVPYSPMLASALAVSGLFWMYVGIIYTSKGVTVLSKAYSFSTERLDVRAAPMTSIALVILLFFVSLEVLSFVVSLIWRTVF